jgi:hypothetical protein
MYILTIIGQLYTFHLFPYIIALIFDKYTLILYRTIGKSSFTGVQTK